MKPALLALSLSALVSTTSFAAQEINLQDSIAVTSQETLLIDIAVGGLTLKTHSGSEITVDVEVSEADNKWFSSQDLSDITLGKDISRDQIKLEVDVEDTKQQWVVAIPASMNIEVNMGVGEVDLRGIEADVEVDIGVGEADVELASTDYRRIDLETGVGDAQLEGFTNIKATRAMVSKDLVWEGDGQHLIKVDVGVGDIDVH